MLELCSDLPLERVQAGEVLIAEGAAPSRLLVLVSGTVIVERGETAFAGRASDLAGQLCCGRPAGTEISQAARRHVRDAVQMPILDGYPGREQSPDPGYSPGNSTRRRFNSASSITSPSPGAVGR